MCAHALVRQLIYYKWHIICNGAHTCSICTIIRLSMRSSINRTISLLATTYVSERPKPFASIIFENIPRFHGICEWFQIIDSFCRLSVWLIVGEGAYFTSQLMENVPRTKEKADRCSGCEQNHSLASASLDMRQEVAHAKPTCSNECFFLSNECKSIQLM